MGAIRVEAMKILGVTLTSDPKMEEDLNKVLLSAASSMYDRVPPSLMKIFKLVTFIPPTHHLVTPSIVTMYAKYLLISTIFRTCANQFYFC